MSMKSLPILSVVAVLLLAFAACQEQTSNTGNKELRNRRNGIDLSHYQGTIDWDSLGADTAIGFVYVKASEGTDIRDDMYHFNMFYARKHNFIVGSYHFFVPTVSPVLQFYNFKRVVSPSEIDLAPIVDVETKKDLTKEEFRDSLQIFLDSMEVYYGKRPVIYTLWAFYHECLQGYFPGYKLMIARYCEQMPVLRDSADYIIWQHKCDGRKMGIKHNVDLNVVTPGHSIKEIMYERSLFKIKEGEQY